MAQHGVIVAEGFKCSVVKPNKSKDKRYVNHGFYYDCTFSALLDHPNDKLLSTGEHTRRDHDQPGWSQNLLQTQLVV